MAEPLDSSGDPAERGISCVAGRFAVISRRAFRRWTRVRDEMRNAESAVNPTVAQRLEESRYHLKQVSMDTTFIASTPKPPGIMPSAPRIPTAAALLAACVLALQGCGDRPPAEPVPPSPPPAFDAGAAFEELENIVSFGSRAHGAPGHTFMAGYLQARLGAMGFETSAQAFTNETPLGTRVFRNIEAKQAGDDGPVIILSTHYDSLQGAGDEYEAANAAGSGPAVLLELARIVSASYEGPAAIRFVFFDGQEPMVKHSPGDGLRGSRHYAGRIVASGEENHVLAVINLNLVGDADLTITVPKNVDNDLRAKLLRAARTEQTRSNFQLFPFEIGDDHDPFYRAYIPAINIIDFQYGSQPGRNDYWRTPEDTIDKLSADSLGVVGRTVTRLVWDLAAGE